MDGNTPDQKAAGHTVKKVTMWMEHPFIRRLDPESIRVFIRKCDAHHQEIDSRASQPPQESTVSLQPVCPVSLIYCANAEKLESAVECGMLEGCRDVEKLTSDELRKLLDEESQESQTFFTESDLSQIFKKWLKRDIKAKSETGRMKLFCMEYKSLLRTNGLKWVPEETPKVSRRHVLSTIIPGKLPNRLYQVIKFSHHHLK